eukprot:TRINITY_DN62817_c0_g1_i1.p1 TRINITY_DN62817_c0_g1~~TRINITY_DN62817_c0_g1_i1.p1  ORF type:complete len:493 (-),score=88.51 TRINITY_DN62817_c0_g1_i1:158-1636(-)
MSTAAEIRAQIAETKRRIEDKQRVLSQAVQEKDEAIERQHLRRQLEDLQKEEACYDCNISYYRRRREGIDQDSEGPHLKDNTTTVAGQRPKGTCEASIAEELKRTSFVAKGEYLWKIAEMSWLFDALQHTGEESLLSSNLSVGDSEFTFQYAPAGGKEGTLAIVHCDSEKGGAIFRYKIFIQRRGGDFVQWGETGHVCMPHDSDASDAVFGPDVPKDGVAAPQGIFGLSHTELLKSDWVENDILTARFELEVRLSVLLEHVEEQVKVEVPSATLSTDLASILDSERCSDVTFLIEGEMVKAHSQVLCSRSEVFDKLFNGGMCESVSREVRIEDCSASTFKALMKFLYTDNFICMEDALREASHGDQSSNTTGIGSRATWLQSVLAVSHKYSLARLQAWCEKQLCESISVKGVCDILCQAHLYDAKQLTNACLNFIKRCYAEVVVTQSFGKLAKDWPEVMLKINLCTAGVAEASATPALEASQRASGKRKRDE